MLNSFQLGTPEHAMALILREVRLKMGKKGPPLIDILGPISPIDSMPACLSCQSSCLSLS